ncbi:ALP1-like protein isoform X1 [Tanacetum coccineum]
MNSYTLMGLDDEEEGEEISSRKKSFIKRAITRHLFSETSMYNETRFRKTFRMARPLFQPDSECTVMEIYGPEYLRKPMVTDVENFYRHHEEKHGFSGMLRIIDCTDWEWFGFPYAFKAQYVRLDHGSNLFILLEAVVSKDLWIWHAFFGVVGSNNDIKIFMVGDAILFEDLKLKNLKQASIALKQGKSMIITELAESKKDHAIELLAKLKVGMDELQKIAEDRK